LDIAIIRVSGIVVNRQLQMSQSLFCGATQVAGN